MKEFCNYPKKKCSSPVEKKKIIIRRRTVMKCIIYHWKTYMLDKMLFLLRLCKM